MSIENGRVRAFTPGWLERESIFLHMEYKYFLGLFKAGLYEEFYEAIEDALIPFQKPEMYGRSILENSSFLASSANPDPSVHGQGFVARLSGSTVEMLSMWIGMFLGNGGFKLEEDELRFVFDPKLSAKMFDDAGEAAFTLCGSCEVIYHNAGGKATFGEDAAKVKRIEYVENEVRIAAANTYLCGEEARKVREGKITQIHVFLA